MSPLTAYWLGFFTFPVLILVLALARLAYVCWADQQAYTRDGTRPSTWGMR